MRYVFADGGVMGVACAGLFMCVTECALGPKGSIINIPRWQQGGSPGTTQTRKGNSSTSLQLSPGEPSQSARVCLRFVGLLYL